MGKLLVGDEEDDDDELLGRGDRGLVCGWKVVLFEDSWSDDDCWIIVATGDPPAGIDPVGCCCCLSGR